MQDLIRHYEKRKKLDGKHNNFLVIAEFLVIAIFSQRINFIYNSGTPFLIRKELHPSAPIVLQNNMKLKQNPSVASSHKQMTYFEDQSDFADKELWVETVFS